MNTGRQLLASFNIHLAANYRQEMVTEYQLRTRGFDAYPCSSSSECRPPVFLPHITLVWQTREQRENNKINTHTLVIKASETLGELGLFGTELLFMQNNSSHQIFIKERKAIVDCNTVFTGPIKNNINEHITKCQISFRIHSNIKLEQN